MKLRIVLFTALFAFTLGQAPANPPATNQPPVTLAPNVPAATDVPANLQPETTAAPAAAVVTKQPAVEVTTEAPSAPTTAPPPPPTTAAPPAPTTAPPPPPTTPAPKETTTTQPTTTQPTPPETVESSLQLQTGDTYCFLMNVQMQFHFCYKDTNGDQHNVYVNLAKNASVVDSTCTTGNQIIHINFTVDGASKPYTLTFNFTQDDDKYYMETLTLNFLADSGLYPLYARAGNELEFSSHNTSQKYDVKNTYAYKCIVEDYILLDTSDATSVMNVTFTDFTFQAFGKLSTANYGNFDECDADFTTSDIVPIAVGCALAALVVIVLIAYLIGRKRSRQKGYQSV